MKTPRSWPQLYFDYEGLPLIRPCLHLEAHIAWAEGPEILDFYQSAREALGPLLSHSVGARGSVPLNSRHETQILTWLQRPEHAMKKTYGCILSGPYKCAFEASLQISLFKRPYVHPTPEQEAINWRDPTGLPWLATSMVRVGFPIDHPLAEPTRLIEWVHGLEIFKNAYTFSANVGFCLNAELSNPPHAAYDTVRDRASALMLRYPGLDGSRLNLSLGPRLFQRCFEYMEFMGGAYARPYVKRANWLTWLTEDQVRFIGGLDGLRQQLAVMPSIELHEIGRGLFIQAGPEPRLGDVAEDDYPAEYCVVADAIKKLRLPALDGTGFNHEFDQDGSRHWLGMLEGRNPRLPAALET